MACADCLAVEEGSSKENNPYKRIGLSLYPFILKLNQSYYPLYLGERQIKIDMCNNE